MTYTLKPEALAVFLSDDQAKASKEYADKARKDERHKWKSKLVYNRDHVYGQKFEYEGIRT